MCSSDLVLICPGVTVTPFPFDQLYPTEIDGAPMENYVHWAGLTSSLTVMGNPVVAMPCGKDENGTPFGIQVVGLRRTLRGDEGVEIWPADRFDELLGWADAVLCMTGKHRDYLIDQYPEFTDKTHLFMEFALGEETDVPDPIGQPVGVYRTCRDSIEKGLESLLEKHASEKT